MVSPVFYEEGYGMLSLSFSGGVAIPVVFATLSSVSFGCQSSRVANVLHLGMGSRVGRGASD